MEVCFYWNILLLLRTWNNNCLLFYLFMVYSVMLSVAETVHLTVVG